MGTASIGRRLGSSMVWFRRILFLRMGYAKRVVLALSALTLCTTASAQACIVSAPFHVEDIRQADVVLRGRLIRYEVMRPKDSHDYAILTVRTDGVLKGKVPDDVQLYWSNSTFGVPPSMAQARLLLIAATTAHGSSFPLRGPSATIYPNSRPELLQILQAPCSKAFILPYSQDSETNIRDILAGKSVNAHDYFPSFAPKMKNLSKSPDNNSSSVLSLTESLIAHLLLIMSIVLFYGSPAFAILLLVWIWRRWKKGRA